MKPIFDKTIHDTLNKRLDKLEQNFSADFLFYYGEIFDGLDKYIRDVIEELKKDVVKHETLCVMLNTPGGSAETVEKIVRIIRHHYNKVYFIIPDSAYSAGTILCCSGDKIYMDYSSSLGPIDPQVRVGDNFVPALGYLDKVAEMIAKQQLSEAEIIFLKGLDIAMLRSYEQARDLTVALLKEWLVKYKFSTWNTHSSTSNPVTIVEKEARAKEVADVLGDNKKWHSHGRGIGINELTQIVKLKIDDYSNDVTLQPMIRDYNDLICEYIRNRNLPIFVHTRKFI